MVDPFKSIRDLLAVARVQLGTDERTTALVDRIQTVENQLTPGHAVWHGQPTTADAELIGLVAGLHELTRPMQPTATKADPLKQSATPELPANINGAINAIAKARSRLAGTWSSSG